MSDAVSRARDDLAAGRAWKARDRLRGVLAHRQDREVLELLASVHHTLGDLPAAGALWFVTGRADAPAQEAIAAWRERHGGPQAQWFSIASTVREEWARSRHLVELARAAGRQVPANPQGWRSSGRAAGREPEAWWEPVVFGGGCLLGAIVLVGLLLVGTWTVWHWIWG